MKWYPGAVIETIEVPAHETQRLTLGDWTFTFARTGCLRVQRGDFCAYVPAELVEALHHFLGPDARGVE